MKWIAFAPVAMTILLTGCAALDKAFGQFADQTCPRDPVTGERTPNAWTEEQEIQSAVANEKTLIEGFRSQGIGVDTDKQTLGRLSAIMKRIARVSHRPQLPWDIHLVETDEINAYTFGGGKIFVLRGFLASGVNSDDELAAIIAHEAAHCTCRHIPEQVTWSQYGSLFSKKVSGKMYQAAFSTESEEEADKVSMLYLALAGYDPKCVPAIWTRFDQKYGSAPGNYLYDHPLHGKRAQLCRGWAAVANKYYAGKGKRNANYVKILAKNDLVPRVEQKGESGVADFIEAGGNTYIQHLKTQTEVQQRETQKKVDELQAQQQQMIKQGFRLYTCYSCKKQLWGKPGTSGGCPYCRAQIAFPKQ